MSRLSRKAAGLAGRGRTQPAPAPVPAAQTDDRELWKDLMRWEADASDAASRVVRHNAQELRDEAERIAVRAKASSVSPEYVRQASDRLYLHSPSASADVQMAVGGMILGIAGGFGAALLITPVHIALWIGVLAVMLGILGTALFSIGCTLKMRNR